LLYNWKIPSQNYDLITNYKLVQQHWLIKDNNQRQNMTNGIGPMGLVKNRMNYSLWPGKRTYKMPDDIDSRSGGIIKGIEAEEDGILTFAMANQ